MVDNRLIHLPYFLYLNTQLDELSTYEKIKLIIKGKLISFIYSKFSDKNFCKMINTFFKFNNSLGFEKNLIVVNQNDIKYFFPNTFRALVYLHDFDDYHTSFLSSYCLDDINFFDNDTIVDCGANIGELDLAIRSKNPHINYIAFEPDPNAYKCLELNSFKNKRKLFNVALSNKTGKENLYIDSVGANSSIEYFGEQNSIEVDCEKLDFYKLKNIKLLKMDAEGHEPEVLQGSLKTLKNIQYISIDFGNERGVNKDHTFIEVNNILIRNNFNLIKYSQTRMSGLYKNKNFNE